MQVQKINQKLVANKNGENFKIFIATQLKKQTTNSTVKPRVLLFLLQKF
jgi:hypothetical protein